MPSVGLYFGIYSYSKEKLYPLLKRRALTIYPKGELDESPLSEAMLRTLTIATAATIGNTVASFSRVPYEVVKQKLQTGEYSSTFGAIGTMWAESGMRAFFPMGGVTIQMMRDIPYAIVTLLSYECLREHWVTKAENGSPYRDMIAGGMAGGLGSWGTNPMDVLKTRMQIDDGGAYGGSVITCASKTFHEDGPMAFWRGSVPRLMHKVPANATFFVFYEFFRKVLGVNELEPDS